jgi:hypothetical protein
VLEPEIKTTAPITGSPVFLSLTFPLRVPCWAKQLKDTVKRVNTKNSFFIKLGGVYLVCRKSTPPILTQYYPSVKLLLRVNQIGKTSKFVKIKEEGRGGAFWRQRPKGAVRQL